MAKKLSKRWQLAQSHEKNFWEGYTTESLLKQNEELILKKLKIYSKMWEKITPITNNTRILCIGCGPIDLINYSKQTQNYSIDPLADFFKENFKFDYNASRLEKGVGEDIPYEDNFFDIVILRNVLDHTDNPEKVLLEIKRVLKKTGLVHIEAHYYQKGFLQLAKFWALQKKLLTRKIFNPNHPHMFSLEKMKNLIQQNFSIQQEEAERDVGVYENKSELKSTLVREKLTKKLPAIFGLLGNINYLAICKKK
tara:strand:+ start:381 stop:1136 length:756 start_codon:yes stop_codon:yes gene_type:complete